MGVLLHSFTDNALKILEKRYLQKDNEDNCETPETLFRRVSCVMAEVEFKYGATTTEVEEWEKRFFDLMWSLDFIPNSPTLMNAGIGAGTLSACYVMDIEDNMSSIMDVAKDQAMIEKFGGGVGFSLSGLRPKGHPISTTQGKACGPINVLRVLSQVGTMITQGGRRDGAHMAIMEVYHPDIEEFIHCKNTEGEITNFNISVGADSTFMEAVQRDKLIHLTWPLDRHVYDEAQDDGRYVKAREIFNEIIHGAWTNGEPGMVWLDRINEDNTTPAIGRINATNPCGEQPLLSGESCNLGSINVGNFISNGSFDFDRFIEVVPTCIQFLDNVVDANKHPTSFTQQMNESTRKVGLGLMGFADLLVRLSIPYDSEEALDLAKSIGETLKNAADNASSTLAEIKGSFPAFDQSTLNQANGGDWNFMRNAWRLSIAPTGTISMIANCSSGIEPLFDLAYKKHNMSAALEGMELFYINDDLKNYLGVSKEDIANHLDKGHSVDSMMDYSARKIFIASDSVHHEWHVKMQAMFQQYVDSGISKTINLPHEATQYDIGMAYEHAWELGCKGITVYRRGSREREVLVSTDSNLSSFTACNTQPARPHTLVGSTTTVSTGHGKMYVTINYSDNQMYEIFATVGKAGACEGATTEALCRLTSTALQYGVPLEVIIKQLDGITCCPVWDHGKTINSLADGISHVLKQSGNRSIHANGHGDATTIDNFNEIIVNNNSSRCPECGQSLQQAEGCYKCVECGYSRCG